MKNFILILVLSIAVNCQGQNKTSENVKILQKIIEIPELTNFKNPKSESNIPPYILPNQFITKDINLSNYEYDIEVSESISGNDNYLKIYELQKSSESAEFTVYYKIENMEITGTLVKISNEWRIEDYNTIEF